MLYFVVSLLPHQSWSKKVFVCVSTYPTFSWKHIWSVHSSNWMIRCPGRYLSTPLLSICAYQMSLCQFVEEKCHSSKRSIRWPNHLTFGPYLLSILTHLIPWCKLVEEKCHLSKCRLLTKWTCYGFVWIWSRVDLIA